MQVLRHHKPCLQCGNTTGIIGTYLQLQVHPTAWGFEGVCVDNRTFLVSGQASRNSSPDNRGITVLMFLLTGVMSNTVLLASSPSQ